ISRSRSHDPGGIRHATMSSISNRAITRSCVGAFSSSLVVAAMVRSVSRCWAHPNRCDGGANARLHIYLLSIINPETSRRYREQKMIRRYCLLAAAGAAMLVGAPLSATEPTLPGCAAALAYSKGDKGVAVLVLY